MATKRPPRTLVVRDPDRRKALASPIRLEILGHFTGSEPLSVRDIAERMGRPPNAIHYHVHRLAQVGLVERVGERPGTRKPEALFAPVADRFDLTPQPHDADQHADLVNTLQVAQRMAARDMGASLRAGTGRYDGPERNFLATRAHGALTAGELSEVNAHLDAIVDVFDAAAGADLEVEDREFCSLTFALLPLPDRRRP